MAVPPLSITENINSSATTLPTIKTAYCYSFVPLTRIMGCHVPIILSLHMHLGVCFKPDSLAMPVTLQGISYQLILLYLTVAALAVCTFLCSHVIDPYIRRLVRRFRHSHHMHFIDPRPIGYTVHLWTDFVPLPRITVSLSRLYRAFDIIGFPKMPIGI